MKVSIITIVYNNRHTIANAIESVLAQAYSDIEYIIVDGGSTDGTLEIIKAYDKRITKFITEKDNGLYDAINKGICLATGNIVGFLHSDDLFTNNHAITKVVNAFLQHDTDSIYADLVYVSRNYPDKIIRNWKSGSFKRSNFLYGWMPPHPTFYVKKSVYDAHGLYNTAFKSAADYELMLRYLYKHNISTSYLPEVLVKMRVGGKSNITLKNRIRANLEDNRAWLINDLNPPFYTRFLKPLRKLVQYL